MAAYVPIDLHRHRSVVMHMAEDGEVLGWTRLANDPETLVAEVLKAKESEGVLSLRFDAEAIVSYLFAVGDGFALQALSDPSRDNSGALAAGAASARYLLVNE